MKIKHLLKTPTMLVRPDRTAVRVGGPHCVRECGETGLIWVALKVWALFVYSRSRGRRRARVFLKTWRARARDT